MVQTLSFYQTSITFQHYNLQVCISTHIDRALHCIGKESTHQAENCSAHSEQFYSHSASIFPRHGNLPLIKRGGVGQRIRLAQMHMVWSLPNLETERETPDATNERRYILWVKWIYVLACQASRERRKRISILYCYSADLNINADMYCSWKLVIYIFCFICYILTVYWSKSIQTNGALCLWQCLFVSTACTWTQGFRTRTLFAPNLFQLVPIWSNLSRQCSLQLESNDSELRLKSQFLVRSRWLLASCVELIEERPQKSPCIAISFHFFFSNLCQTVPQ